jgi:hypothetical protein
MSREKHDPSSLISNSKSEQNCQRKLKVGKLKRETRKQAKAVVAAQSYSDQDDSVSISESG